MRTSLRRILPAALVALVGACAATEPELVPASGYRSTTGNKRLAVESRGGASMTADGTAWHSPPEKLPTEVTPVWVTLHNTTGQPIRIQYDEFTLKEPSGAIDVALAPYNPRAPASSPTVEVPNGGYLDKFDVAPYLAPAYPWLAIWDGPLPHGPSDQSVAALPGLPTDAMLARALPEGVLENDGTVGGYLYFQKVQAKKGEVRLRAVLQPPTPAGQPADPVASIDIPFRRTSGQWPSTKPLYAPMPNYTNWMITLP